MWSEKSPWEFVRVSNLLSKINEWVKWLREKNMKRGSKVNEWASGVSYIS